MWIVLNIASSTSLWEKMTGWKLLFWIRKCSKTNLCGKFKSLLRKYYLLLPRAARMISPGIRTFITHEQSFRCLFAENSRWIIHHQKEMRGQSSTHKYALVKWLLTVSSAHTSRAWGQITTTGNRCLPQNGPSCACAISLSRELSQRFNISQRLHCLQRSEEPVTLSPILDFLQLGATVGSSNNWEKSALDMKQWPDTTSVVQEHRKWATSESLAKRVRSGNKCHCSVRGRWASTQGPSLQGNTSKIEDQPIRINILSQGKQ